MANLQSLSLDPLGQSAIELGLEQIDILAKQEEIILKLDELTKQRLKRLSSSMSLSFRTVVEVAINYTYDYVKESKINPDDLPRIAQGQGDFPFKIVLSLETLKKLEYIRMSQAVSECAVIGINLLHDRLIVQDVVSYD
jgi:hypothetical protein